MTIHVSWLFYVAVFELFAFLLAGYAAHNGELDGALKGVFTFVGLNVLGLVYLIARYFGIGFHIVW